MKDFRVIWEIDIRAKSPKAAAKQALEIQRDCESLANVFGIYEEGGKSFTVDLTSDTIKAGYDNG